MSTKPFDPKVVVYEIYGQPGATADVNYLDLDAQPQRIDGVWPAVDAAAGVHRAVGVPQHRGPGRRQLDQLPHHRR